MSLKNIYRLIAVSAVLLLVAWTGITGSHNQAAEVQHPHLVKTHTVSMSLDGLNQTMETAGAYGSILVAQEQEKRAAEKRAAEAARAKAQSVTPAPRRTGVNWDGIARCETGGNWSHQTKYDGGLGILHVAWVNAMHGTAEWASYDDLGYAEYGSQATREQQIIVAERIYAKYGLSGWGCKAYG